MNWKLNGFVYIYDYYNTRIKFIICYLLYRGDPVAELRVYCIIVFLECILGHRYTWTLTGKAIFYGIRVTTLLCHTTRMPMTSNGIVCLYTGPFLIHV